MQMKAKEVSDSNTYRQANLSSTRCLSNDIDAFLLGECELRGKCNTGFHIAIEFPIDCGS